MNCHHGCWFLLLLATSTASAQSIRPDEVVENARRAVDERTDGVMAVVRRDVAKRIGLTDEQGKQIEEAFRELVIARHEARSAGQEARVTREQFPNNGATKKEIKELGDKADKLHELSKTLEVSVPRRIDELLTPEQKKKLAEIRPPEMQAVRMDIPTKNLRTLLASGDGKTLAVADNTEVRLYRLRGNELLHTLKAENPGDPSDPLHPFGPTTMAFSADGRTLAVVWNTKAGPFQMTYWNVADGTLVRSHAAPTGARRDIVFSPDLSLIAGHTDKNALQVWRGDNGAKVWTVEELGALTRRMGFSADAKQLYLGLDSGALSIRNAADGMEMRQVKLFDGHKYKFAWPSPLALSPDGKLIAVRSTESGFATIFNIETGKEEQSVPVIGRFAYSLAFVDDGDAFVTHSGGGLVVWDLKRRAERAIYALGVPANSDASLRDVASDAAGRVFVAIITHSGANQVVRITE